MSNNDLKFKRFVNLMAFVALLLVATALITTQILKIAGIGDVKVIQIIANIGWLISTFVLVFVSYFYVKTKRKPIWMLLYAVAVTIVVILLVLNFFN